MLATCLFEGEPDAVVAVSPGAGSALFRDVGRHLAHLLALAGDRWPATQSGVRMYASSEHHQPDMVKPETSSSNAISHARYSV